MQNFIKDNESKSYKGCSYEVNGVKIIERTAKITPTKIGQFVTARISGKTLENVFIAPNRAVYQGSYIFVVEDNVIRRREIELLWQDNENSIIGTGVVSGDVIVTTPLNDTISGTRVETSLQ